MSATSSPSPPLPARSSTSPGQGYPVGLWNASSTKRTASDSWTRPPSLPVFVPASGCRHSLRAVLEGHEIGSTLTRSELEEAFLALCRESGVPAPLVNAPLLGLTVDFLWPQAALVAELDGRASHDTRHAFQDDRDRDSMLLAAGFRTLRFTWWDVAKRPGVVTNRLCRALAV